MDEALISIRNDRIEAHTLKSLSGKYTQEQYDDEYSKQITLETFRELRQERKLRLTSTDFLMTEDYPFPSPEIRQAWKTYRQALRNLPVTSPASYDENGLLVVTWPTPPNWPANVV